jgi:PAS domain S-box-containing protein
MLEQRTKTYHFLEGGGELGELTRSFHWSQTPLGPFEQWPQSLRTMVDVILHSEFPMLLWWGDELIQFYNDAYRATLGDKGKHPRALGQKAEQCWPETWHLIKPLIDHVRKGGAIWTEDQLIPIFRNGRIEDVYWTFGYSAVRDDSGRIAGVLVICNETTRQVTALQKVEESERTLRSIIINAPVGICILKGDELRAEVVNDIFLELTGRKREELEGKPYWDVLTEIKETYAPIVDTVATSGASYRGKEEKLKLIRHGREETLYIDYMVEPLKPKKDEPERKVMILAIDVTDKVVARHKVEESEQRYRTLITEATVAIALYTGPDFRIQYVNEIMTGYWGKDASVMGKTLEEALPEISGQSFLKKLNHVYETGETYIGTSEEALLNVNGKLQAFYFNYVYKALRDCDGKAYAIHHMAMDVTEQVVANKRVEQSEENLRNIISRAPVAMCIFKGSEFVVEIANERMIQLWGKKREEVIYKPIFQGLPEVRHQGFEEILERVYRTGETHSASSVPVTLPRTNGIVTVYVNFVYEAFREADGSISGIMAVATEVTEQVIARQKIEDLVQERTKELAESNKNLQRSNEELAQFAYIASHDLQEPARKIKTFAEMLQKNLKEADPRSKLFLDKIGHSAERELSLIRDILNFSQLAKEKQQYTKVDLNEVLKNVKDDFELLIEEKKAVITSDPLPVIEGIAVQISQLFANLISNGLKFSDKKRIPLIAISCITVPAEEIKGIKELKDGITYYKISFRDNGIGFNQKNARQIFDIFQRLHRRTEYEGTGIGLAMCRKIVQNHNGDLYAESVEGQGSVFHVYLPLACGS